jgi:hypothetical protein
MGLPMFRPDLVMYKYMLGDVVRIYKYEWLSANENLVVSGVECK